MEDKISLLVCLSIWIFIIGWMIRIQWSRRIPSAGLCVTYLFNLSMIHWFGALIYALPWYLPTDLYLVQSGVSRSVVAEGFIQSTYGIIGFALGSTILARLLVANFRFPWLKEIHYQPNSATPRVFIFLGITFYFAIAPLAFRIPSFGALAVSGVYLLIVGLCLSCWKAWCLQDKRALLMWLGAACLLPLLTLLTLGFTSFGAGASLVVLLFVFNFYRPRWKAIIASTLAVILGLSVFVTYLAGRQEIRATVWRGGSAQSRIETVLKTATTFELFNLYKHEHLEAIDIRLNQNVLVGQAVESITRHRVDYANGNTLFESILAIIPRFIWPEKPVFAGGSSLASRYTGRSFASNVSIGVGQVLDFYINFGSPGVFSGFLVYGSLLGAADIIAGRKLIYGNWLGFTFWFLPSLGLINAEGYIGEIIGRVVSSIIFVYCMNYLLNKFHLQIPLARKQKVSTGNSIP